MSLSNESINKVSIGPGTLLGPLPSVLVSCGSLEKPNLITIGWTGIINSEPPMLSISLRPSRYSYELIVSDGKFIVNLVTASMTRALDFCGVKSGRNLDKFAATGLTPEKLLPDFPPAVAESPVALICEVKEKITLGSHDCFIAYIKDVFVRPQLLDKNGALCLYTTDLVNYLHGNYYTHSEWIGFFGYSVAQSKISVARSKKIMHLISATTREGREKFSSERKQGYRHDRSKKKASRRTKN